MSAIPHFRTPKEDEEERFSEYTLMGLIPVETTIFVDLIGLTMLMIQNRDGTSHIIELQRFTPAELPLVLEMFSNFPYHTPFENLQSVSRGRSIEYHRRAIELAKRDNTVDELLKPLRKMISRIRPRLHTFGIDVKCLIETGYILMPDEKK